MDTNMPRSTRSKIIASIKRRNRERRSFIDNVVFTIIRQVLKYAATYLHSRTFGQKRMAKRTSKGRKLRRNKKNQQRSKISITAEKWTSLIEHGLHYIMLPLNILHLCIWGIRFFASASKESSTAPAQRLTTPPSLIITSCAKASFSPTRDAKTVVESSQSEISIEKSLDNCSDEAITAQEDFNESSNDFWSNAQDCSSTCMDAKSFQDHEKRISSDDDKREEKNELPEMKETEIEKTSDITSKSISGKSVQTQSDVFASSDTKDELFSDFSSTSSLHREITKIFEILSGSDDEEELSMSGRRNNVFFNEPQEIVNSEYPSSPCQKRSATSWDGDSMKIPAKRCQQSNSWPPENSINRGFDFTKENVETKGNWRFDKIGDRTDSVYSQEEREMNFYNEALIRLQYVPKNIRENVMKWMEDEDVDCLSDEDWLIASDDSVDDESISDQSEDESSDEVGYQFAEYPWIGFEGRENQEFFQNQGNNDQRFDGETINPLKNSCHCGDPNCYLLSLAQPSEELIFYTQENYPRAPSPLRHLYYDYPEFMGSPTDTTDLDKTWGLIPCATN